MAESNSKTDPKLRKMLFRSRPAEGADIPDDKFYRNILSQTPEADFLLAIPPGAGRIAAAAGIISRVQGNIWYVIPWLTRYKMFWIKAGLGNTAVSVMSLFERGDPDARVVLWSPDILAHYLAIREHRHRPELILFDDTGFIGHPQVGGGIEECLLGLPADIPVLLMCARVSAEDYPVRWLENIRRRPCRVSETDPPYRPGIPAFISSQWEMMPLTDKKRVSGKVKRILRETRPLPNIRSPWFVLGLVSLLRKEKLTPAAVIMPYADDCDYLLRSCPDAEVSAGDVLTRPVIMALLDRHPFLKNHPLVSLALSKRAASFHPGQDPLWRRLVEHFLFYGCMDVIFTDVRGAEEMTEQVRTVVLCGSRFQVFPASGSHRVSLSRCQGDRITELAVPDNPGHLGCVALIHSADADTTLVKDLLTGAHPWESAFRCDSRSVLRILARSRDQDSLSFSEQLLAGFQSPAFGAFCMEEFQAQLNEEIPDHRCSGHVQSVSSLRDMRLSLIMRVNKKTRKSERSRGPIKEDTEEERFELETLVSELPCDECPHFSQCHKRGGRRFRRLLEEYCEIWPRLKTNITGTRLYFDYYKECLREFDLIDQKDALTEAGRFALKTGLKLPQALTQSFMNRVLPDDQDILFAITGGFAERKPEIRKQRRIGEEEETEMWEVLLGEYREIAKVYRKMEPVLEETRERMLKFGILIPEYELIGPSILLAWKRGTDLDILVRRTKIPAGMMAEFIDEAVYINEVRG